MNGLLRVGRILFGIAMVLFGVEFLIFLTAMHGPLPGPPWSRGTMPLDWLACLGFIVAGVSLVTGKMARLISMLLGVVLLLYGLIRYLPALVTRLHDPGPWTVLFEILALVGGAWVLAASLPADGSISQARGSLVWRMADVGRYLIAISLVVFAVQHFMYAKFVAGLVTPWIPWHLFWTYFAGVAFAAVALSLVFQQMVRLSAGLLGVMFLLWVVVLHAVRVAAAPRNGDEMTSLLVALAMSGLGFILAGAYGGEEKRRGASAYE
jgi:uncharacterized membrane protein/uncharacterized membrane protein YphA (DoxX/SURF4 family)